MKRVLSLVLSLALLLGSIPMVISAAAPNDFQTNFSINTQPDAWTDTNGQEYNTVKVDYQLKGTGLSGPQGAWIAVDLNKFTWVHNTKNGESIFDKVTLVPGAAPVQVSNKNYYKLKDTVTDEDSGEDVDAWTPTLNLICAVALSADGKTLYIGTYPMQTLSVTYNELTTVMSFRFAVLPGASLESDSIRFINAEEQVVLNQSYVFGMNDGNKGYYYGSTTEPDTLAAMPFTGNAGITGVPTVHAVAPVITVPPVGADYYLDVAATPLTVSATVSDGGILSYAWYRNNTGSITDGELVSTGASCPIATNAISDAYYYVVVTNTNLFVNGNTTASVTSTPVRVTVSKDPDITTLENAKAILESAAALTVNQADCPTANDVRNYVHSELSKLVAGLDLVVTPITYIPSSPGTSANPTGTTGTYIYTVTITRNGKSLTTEQLTAQVAAVWYDGVTDEQAAQIAKDKLLNASWDSLPQIGAESIDAITAALTEQAKGIVGNAAATVSVSVTSVSYAQAGSASTSHGGESGWAIFDVTVGVGAHTHTVGAQNVSIIPTYYNGQLNSEALTVATDALNGIAWNDIPQTTANTEADVIAYIKNKAEEAIAAENVGVNKPVPVEVSVNLLGFNYATAGAPAVGRDGYPGEATFTVTVTVAGQTYVTDEEHFVITATKYDGQLTGEALVLARDTVEALAWSDIAQATANTQDDVVALIKNRVEAAIADANKNVNIPVPVTVSIIVDSFTAAEAGSVTLGHNGITGSIRFAVRLEVSPSSYVSTWKSFDIIATEYNGQLNSEALTVATNTLNVIDWADIAQTTANTEADVTALIETLAKAAIAEANANFTDPVPVDVTVTVTEFTAAQAGSASIGHDGIAGIVKFTVTATVAGTPYTTAEKTFDITATPYAGQLNSEALTVATNTLNVIDWADIAQTTANTEEDVIALIETLAKAAIAEANASFTDPVPVTVTVNVNSFTAAQAGSASIGHDGIAGIVKFTVTATVAGTPYTTAEKTFDITATPYNGQLNSEALTVATNTLNVIDWADIAQTTANTEEDVIALIETLAKAAIAEANANFTDPVPVTVTVNVNSFTAAVAGSPVTGHTGIPGSVAFTVTATVAGDSYTTAEKTFDITATPYAGQLNSEALTVATNTLNVIVWEDIIQATANTENAVIAEITKIANAAIAKANEGVNTPVPVDVTVDVTEFTAAVAGSSSTSREGRVGSVAFTVTATVAGDSYTTGEKSFDIIATEYTGVMDNEAVDAAKDVLDALTETTVTVKIGATANEILAYVKAHLQSFMDGDATGVTVSVTAGTNGQYTATLTKGNKSVQTTVTLTVEEEDPIKLDAPDGLSFNQGVASWNAVEHAVSYTVRLYVVNDDTEELFMTEVVTAAQIDFSEYLEEDTSYVFDVIAHGDGIYYVDSNVSENSNVYTVNKSLTPEQIAMILLMLRRSRVEIRAEAGEGGSITDAGVKSFRRGNNVTYRFTPDEGYVIDTVIVDGQSIGAVEEYTFRNVQDAHSILVVFNLAKWQNPFTDVSELNSYYDAVRFVYERGLFEGVSKTEFAPAASMTRAMFVTVLWRLEGMPVVDYAMQYSDVEENTWYTDAIRWASAQGIVEGYGDGIYGTNDAVTVEQAAVIMARYAQHAGKYQAGSAHLGAFADHADVAAWAAEAMQWSVSNGIYMGTAGKLQPAKEAPRSLAAEWMYEYTVRFGN